MTLDFTLIHESTIHARDSISNGKTVHPGLLFVDHLLPANLLEKLQVYICDDNMLWHNQETLTGEIYPGRKKITWTADSVIEEIHVVLDNLTEHLNQRFSRQNKFLGLSVWRDECTFQMIPHYDNPNNDISIQIYLNNDNMDLGTTFIINNSAVKAPYSANHGYLMDNTQNILHLYNGKPPVGYHRYSLHAVWADANK